MLQHTIIQKLTWNCYVSDVTVKHNRHKSYDFVVVKFAKSDNGEFLRSFHLNISFLPYLEDEKKSKRLHTIERVALQPKIPVYHILTWDDVEKKTCTREHVGEIQRDKFGNPIRFSQIVVYCNIDKKNKKGPKCP